MGKGGVAQVKYKIVYYKRSLVGRDPVRYSARQPKGKGTTVFATFRLDPILRKHRDLREAMLKHELNELRAWGAGSTRGHSLARSKEPALTRNIGGVSGFWREIKRREKGGAKT